MSSSDPQPSSDDIIQELLSSFINSAPPPPPPAEDADCSTTAASSAGQGPRPGPAAPMEKRAKRIGSIKIASLKDCVLLRDAAQNCTLGASMSSSPERSGADKHADASATQELTHEGQRNNEDGKPDKSKKKKSKKSKHEKPPSGAKSQNLELRPEDVKPASCPEEVPSCDSTTVCSKSGSEDAPTESSNGDASRGLKRPHDDDQHSPDQSSATLPIKHKKSRNSRSPEKDKKSRSGRSPERHKKSRSSKSPDKRKKSRSRSSDRRKKSRSSRSPDRRKKSRSSKSPDRRKKSRSSRSPDKQKKSRSSKSPDRRKKSRSSRSSSKHKRSRSSRSSDRKSRSKSRDRHSSHRKSKSSRSDREKRLKSSRSPKDHRKSRSSRSLSRHKSSRSSRSKSRRKRSRSSRSPESHRKSSRRKSPRRKKSDSDDDSNDCVKILKDKVTRKRLLEIARRNAMQLVSSGLIPSSLGRVAGSGPASSAAAAAAASSGPRSVQDLTAFCKQLAESADYSEDELGSGLVGSDGEEEVLDLDSKESTFSYSGKHPFAIKDKPIMMNIRNAPMLPVKTNAERLQEGVKLREQFPVSSGSQHRQKDEEWTPVKPDEKSEEQKAPSKTDQEQAPPLPADDAANTVFPSVDEDIMNLNLSEMVSERLRAMRNLQENPNDSTAKQKLDALQETMSKWALSKQEPGKFTGSTGVKVLSQQELSSGQQAWAKKEQLKCAKPVSSAFGMRMLQKMGWSPGEGLGKNKEGSLVPLQLDVKMDKKGFHAQEELTPVKPSIPMTKSLSGKHPVSALVEHCLKCKWQPPQFQVVHDSGPDHKKSYLMKVIVNKKEYRASHTAPTKKLAKATAAAACLLHLGLVPDQSQGGMTCSDAVPHAVGAEAAQEAFPPPVPLSSLTFHGMNITHQFPQQQLSGGGSISYSVGTSSGSIQPLMSINACDYAGRNGNVNIIIGPQIPASHPGFNFSVQEGRKKVPLLPRPTTAPVGAFPPPGVQLESFPPPGCGRVMPTRLKESGRKVLIKTEPQ